MLFKIVNRPYFCKTGRRRMTIPHAAILLNHHCKRIKFFFMLTLTFGTAIFCGIASIIGGFIDAIAGGGGLLTMPALLICGIPPHIALGTNKIGASLGTAVALLNFSANHLVKWRMVIYGVGFSLAGSWIGSLLALALPQALLAKILVILLPCAMVVTLLPGKSNMAHEAYSSGWQFWLLIPLVCAGIGIYDGFFGPGTGSFLILALHWVLRMQLVAASATAKALNLASNLGASLSFLMHGAIFWPLALIMAACLMLGNWLGSNMAIRVGSKAVRKFLAVSLFLLLATLIWQYFIM